MYSNKHMEENSINHMVIKTKLHNALENQNTGVVNYTNSGKAITSYFYDTRIYSLHNVFK